MNKTATSMSMIVMVLQSPLFTAYPYSGSVVDSAASGNGAGSDRTILSLLQCSPLQDPCKVKVTSGRNSASLSANSVARVQRPEGSCLPSRRDTALVRLAIVWGKCYEFIAQTSECVVDTWQCASCCKSPLTVPSVWPFFLFFSSRLLK